MYSESVSGSVLHFVVFSDAIAGRRLRCAVAQYDNLLLPPVNYTNAIR